MRTLVFAALAAALSVSAASAKTICVQPVGPTPALPVPLAGCIATGTIKAAVDAAGGGDIIKISRAIYLEKVEVPPGKDGLQLIGAGKTLTIVDASPYTPRGIGSPPQAAAITIHSKNVQVRNLSLRGGTFGLVTDAPGTLVQGVSVRSMESAGVYVPSPAAYDVQIVGNEFSSGLPASIGVVTSGYGTLIKGNTVEVALVGIISAGDGAQIAGNRVTGGAVGIEAVADGQTVASNDVRFANFGIFAAGSNPIVERNRVTGGQFGIEAECETCYGGSLSFNSVTDTSSFGVLASSDDPRFKVNANVLTRTGFGLSLNGTGIQASLNKAADVGVATYAPCFEIFGSQNLLSKNTASRCSGAGFYFNGSDNEARQNTALNVFENGFTVDGDDRNGGSFARTRLVLNKASAAAAQGFAVINNAQQAELTGNTGSGSHLDFCDDGASTILSGNAFGSSAATAGLDCTITHGQPPQ